MGKGDIKTKRGKIIAGSYGVRRSRKKKTRDFKPEDKKGNVAKKSAATTKEEKPKAVEKKSADKKEVKDVKSTEKIVEKKEVKGNRQ